MNDLSHLDVRIYSFRLSASPEDSAFLKPEGTLIMQAVGFPVDFNDCTCIPKGPVAVLNTTEVTALDAQWYAKASPIYRCDIPDSVGDSPRVKGYLCHQRRSDGRSYPLHSVHVDGNEIQTLSIVGKQVVFRRAGHELAVDLEFVAKEQRFTVSAEWSTSHIELRVSWLENVHDSERGSGDGVFYEDIDAYSRPRSGDLKQFKLRRTLHSGERPADSDADNMQTAGLESEGIGMADFSTRTDELTPRHLEIVVRNFRRDSASDEPRLEFLQYGLSTEVLRFFFGNAWTNENVFPMHTEVSRCHRNGREFLLTEAENPESRFRHLQRVTSLAETVFNLQNIEGMHERISLMDKHDLEAAFGEFECAALLAHPDLKFRFITPCGIRGQDYEGELQTSANRSVCCEMKAKSEKTAAGTDALWRTLEKARRQLPKTRPSMILVKVPERWIVPTISTVVDAAVNRLFRQSNRVVAVVLTWEEYHFTSQAGNFMLKKWRPYPNTKSRLFGSDIEKLLDCLGEFSNCTWLSFRDFIIELL